MKSLARLLKAIDSADWGTYESLCDKRITCFEPEAQGALVEGLAFHAFYFSARKKNTKIQSSICSPRVVLLGNGHGLVTYTRITQSIGDDGGVKEARYNETRVFARTTSENWVCLHFHRS